MEGRGGNVLKKKQIGDHCLVNRRGGKSKERSRMETIVWWNAEGGGSLNKEIEWRPVFAGTQGGAKFN